LGKEDLSWFVTSRKLNDEYKDENKIAHAVLVKREKNLTGKQFQVGDRIEFVYTYDIDVNMLKNSLQGDKIELYDKVKENPDLYSVDYLFYVKNQVYIPCMQLLKILLDEKAYRALEDNISA
jgi:hypothetical protein